MGLRINTNAAALSGIRNLNQSDRALQKSLERLSTGRRINSGADDPSGLVISQRLRAQVNALEQAKENTQKGNNLIRTADSALSETEELLSDIQDSIIFALNEGTSGTLDQVQAEQDSVDAAVQAINRIANTTRFAGTALLNGNSGFDISSNVSDILNDVKIRELDFPQGVQSQTISASITGSAQRAFLSIGSTAGSSDAVVLSGDVTVRITGPRGSEDIILNSTSTKREVIDAINNNSGQTGAFASIISSQARSAIEGGAESQTALLMSEEFGEQQKVRMEVISTDDQAAFIMDNNDDGNDVGQDAVEGDVAFDLGKDPTLNINGQSFTGNGRDFKVSGSFGSLEFSLDPDTSINGVFQPNISNVDAFSGDLTGEFEVQDGGLKFQLGSEPRSTDQINIGIANTQAVTQGFEQIPDVIASAREGDTQNKGGFLNSIKSGGKNDLLTNPENAQKIVRESITKISRLRGYLGATSSFNFEPNQDHLGIAIEKLKSTESDIRDLNFAKESANFTQNQVKFQAGTAVLASANTLPQTALSLLR